MAAFFPSRDIAMLQEMYSWRYNCARDTLDWINLSNQKAALLVSTSSKIIMIQIG